MIALPAYIDPEAWEGFEAMRKLIKKPMTDRARKLIVIELDKLKRAGHSPNEVLDQSTRNCWIDVYGIKDKQTEVRRASEAEQTQAYLAEQASRERTAPPKAVLELASRMRRSA